MIKKSEHVYKYVFREQDVTIGLIGNLLCLTASKPDIIFGVCARFQSYSKESYLIAIKCIIKYLKVTIGMSLQDLKTEQVTMTSYSDADYVSYRVDKKSTSETCKFLRIILFHGLLKK